MSRKVSELAAKAFFEGYTFSRGNTSVTKRTFDGYDNLHECLNVPLAQTIPQCESGSHWEKLNPDGSTVVKNIQIITNPLLLTVQTDHIIVMVLRLFGNPIAIRIYCERHIFENELLYISTCGYSTMTTRERLNAIGEFVYRDKVDGTPSKSFPFRVRQLRHMLYLDMKEWDGGFIRILSEHDKDQKHIYSTGISRQSLEEAWVAYKNKRSIKI